MKLEPGKYYHVYNRGNNSQNIFIDDIDYKYYLKLMKLYLPGAFEVFAYCLMKNHYHLCLKVKDKDEQLFFDKRLGKKPDLEVKWKYFQPEEIQAEYQKKIDPNSMIRFLFNSYSRWYNLKYHRTGSLCEKNFERKFIEDEDHLRNEIIYINTNPVKHRIVNSPKKYVWSSYNEMFNESDSILNRNFVLELFGGKENFKFVNESKVYE
jgi:REP element-mobilizing transposase RayT